MGYCRHRYGYGCAWTGSLWKLDWTCTETIYLEFMKSKIDSAHEHGDCRKVLSFQPQILHNPTRHCAIALRCKERAHQHHHHGLLTAAVKHTYLCAGAGTSSKSEQNPAKEDAGRGPTICEGTKPGFISSVLSSAFFQVCWHCAGIASLTRCPYP